MTGRKGRVVSNEDGNVHYESRSEADITLENMNLAEKERFMNGEKVTLVARIWNLAFTVTITRLMNCIVLSCCDIRVKFFFCFSTSLSFLKLPALVSLCKQTEEQLTREDVYISHWNCHGVQTELSSSLVSHVLQQIVLCISHALYSFYLTNPTLL